MGFRCLAALLLVALFLVPTGEAGAITIDVETIVPEFILEDHIDLTGSTTVQTYTWTEDTANQFSQGTNHNTTVNVTLDQVRLVPSLDIQIMNGGNGVLQGGASDWDRYIIDEVVVEHGGTYFMYYTAGTSVSSLLKYDLLKPYHIGVATSSDGVSWTRYSGNPIIRSRVDPYDYTNVMYPVVLVENGTFHLYYAGNKGNSGASSSQDMSICYANSTDGFNFTKYSNNPVFKHGSPSTSWDGFDVRPGDIGRDFDGKLRMYIKAVGVNQPSNLGVITSTDFLTWQYVVDRSIYAADQSSWEWAATNYNHLEMKNGTYRIWTHAGKPDWRIGWIWSPDGINWTDSGAPIIVPKAGTIYEKFLDNPHCIEMGDHYRVYVTCWDNSGNRQVALFKASPTRLNGTFRSAVKDLGALADLQGARFTSNTSKGSDVVVQLRWSNDSRTWSGWRELGGAWSPDGVSARYVQYGAEFSSSRDWLRPGLDGFSLDYSYPVNHVEVSVDDGPWQEATWNATGWNATVGLRDGDYDIVVRVTDTRGTSVTETIPVQVDLYPPTGSILIEDGRYAHNSTWVKIDVAANDTHGPIEMQMSRTPDFTNAQWWPHYASETYGLLDEPEGNVTIYLRLRDAAGRISETYNDSIVIDTTPPEGTLIINGGAKYTNSTTVTLSLEWTDLTGVVSMMVSNDPDFEGAMWQDPMDAMSWMIGETDGVHTVYVRIRDFVGWETVLTDDIILDRTPPAASLSINRDAEFTTSRDVTLNITLYDENPISFKLVNEGEPWPESWRTTGSPVDLPWVLSTGADGHRTVRMLVRDAGGNEFVAIDDIVLDTTPPEGTLLINDGDPFTNALLVTGTLDAEDATSGLDRMRISDSDDFSDASWQTVKGSFPWSLPPGDGTKNVFVQLRDRAGLVSTIDASIILDTTPPAGSVSIVDVGEFSRSSEVDLAIDVSDDYGLDVMMVSSSDGFVDAEWVPFSQVYQWDLGEEDGAVTVFVRVRDLAGNVFETSVSTILDTTPPEVTVVVPEYTLSRTMDVIWSASDTNGLEKAMYTVKPGPFSSTTLFKESVLLDGVTSVTDMTVQLEITELWTRGEEETYVFFLYVSVWDKAGLTRGPISSFTFVPEVPLGELVIGGGDEWTNVTGVDLELTHTGGLTPIHYRVALESGDLVSTEWSEWGSGTSIDLGPATGERTVWAQLMGAFGIESQPFSDAIKLDTLAPAVDIVSPTGSATEEDSVKLVLSVSDDQDAAPTLEYRLNGGEWRQYAGEVRLSLDEGDNSIEVRSRDAAGNVGGAEASISSDRGLSVGGASWLILLVILIVAVLVGVWYWRKRGDGPEDR